MTAAQSECASGKIDKLSDDEFTKLMAGDGTAFGEELAKECLV